MKSLLVKNARIIDGTMDTPSDPTDIAIENGRFADVGRDLTFNAEEVVDLASSYVLPGLIDCHVHVVATTANLGRNAELPNSWVALQSARIMKSMLMRGFTTVRDLGGADIGLKQAVDENLIDAPRLVICGKALSQSGGHTDYRGPNHCRDVSYYAERLGSPGRICDGVPEVQRAAREEIKNGAQFIKIMADGGVSSPSDPIGYLTFSVDELKAIVEVASNFGTYVAAHLYDDHAIRRALDCGVTCIEHGNLMSDETINRIGQEGQFVVPTNVTYDYLAKEGQTFGLPPESVAKIEDVRTQGLERLAKMKRMGVVMGYGSDLLGGMHVHQSDEFILRARHLPTADVIRSATLDAARVLRMEGQIGCIAPGAFADLVAVDGNPLEDISLLCDQGAHMPLILKEGRAVKTSGAL
ncbi:amidohydrolase family protein [Roseibium album]|uniref:metal-dependent hydrolase family protein n=1 Tax=Roseibium album TaxID=311410 RepID=UPI0039199C5B